MSADHFRDTAYPNYRDGTDPSRMIRDDQICGLEDADMKQAHSGLDYDFSSCDPASSLEVPHGLPHHDFITLASDAHQLWERIRSSLSQQSPHSYDYVDWPQHHDNSQRQISCDGLLAGPGEFLSGASSTKTTVEGCLVDVDTRRNEDLSIISPVEATCTKLLGTQQYHYEDYAEEDGAFYRLEPATIHQSSTPTPICTCNSSGVGDAQANVQAVELGFAQDEITTPFPYKVCGRNHPVATSRTTVCQNHLRDPGSLPFPTLPGPSQSRRTRRRYEEIDRMYECGWNGCRRAYGTLNHLNTHIRKRSHGQKRLSEEFRQTRRAWRIRKRHRGNIERYEEAQIWPSLLQCTCQLGRHGDLHSSIDAGFEIDNW